MGPVATRYGEISRPRIISFRMVLSVSPSACCKRQHFILTSHKQWYFVTKVFLSHSSMSTCFVQPSELSFQLFLFFLQYMVAALGDCVPVLQQVKHEPSPQVMLDLFEKEISDTLHEVSIPKRHSHYQESIQPIFYLFIYFLKKRHQLQSNKACRTSFF